MVTRERLARDAHRLREPEPMVMDEPQTVAEYDQAGATVMLPIHHCNALALSNLLPLGDGLLLDLGSIDHPSSIPGLQNVRINWPKHGSVSASRLAPILRSPAEPQGVDPKPLGAT